MYRKWFILGTLVALVVIGTLVMGGLLVYRVGWTQGSLSSPLQEGAEGGVLVSPMPFGFGHPVRAFGFSPLWIGLRLAIARQLVQAHGRRIDVESDPGQGTTFTIHLPMAAT